MSPERVIFDIRHEVVRGLSVAKENSIMYNIKLFEIPLPLQAKLNILFFIQLFLSSGFDMTNDLPF